MNGTAQTPWLVRRQLAGGADLWGITSAPRQLVAVGTNGTILESVDGQTWTRRPSGTTEWLTAVTYGNGRYIAVGDRGRIVTSTDGVAWKLVTHNATTQRLNNVLFDGKFIAVGEAGTILLSLDGSTWTAVNSGVQRWLRGLAFGVAQFSGASWLATGQSGTVLTSSDGSTWSIRNLGLAADLECAAVMRSFHQHPVAGAGTGSITFAVGGQDGTLRAISVTLNDGSAPSVSVSPNGPGAAGRIRAMASGRRQHVAFIAGGALTVFEDHSDPIVAIDETGRVFADSGANAGTTDRALAPERLCAAVYFEPQNSFYAVGPGETIAQCDQVFNGRMGNIATRGFVGAGEQALIAGFVLQGDASKRVLIRGVGPALASFGVSRPLTRPVLTIHGDAGRVIATNAGWTTGGETAAITTAAAQAGAFALPAGSNDAALLLTLAPGQLYSAQVTGAAGESGVALVEVYDLDSRAHGTARFVNLSTRGVVAAGESVMIAGVVVEGPQWRQLLVRGVGPSLAKFGVGDVLARPFLQLTSQQNAYSTLRLFGSDSTRIAAATAAAGAFPFDAEARDVATLITMPPGTYTFQLAGQADATGIALLEIYDLGAPPAAP